MGMSNEELVEKITNRLLEIANVPFKFHEMDPLDRSYKQKYPISEEQYYIWRLETRTWLMYELEWKWRKTDIFLKWIRKQYGVDVITT
jgi:hypothetical protein